MKSNQNQSGGAKLGYNEIVPSGQCLVPGGFALSFGLGLMLVS